MSDRQEELEASHKVSHEVNQSISQVLNESVERLKAKRLRQLAEGDKEDKMRSEGFISSLLGRLREMWKRPAPSDGPKPARPDSRTTTPERDQPRSSSPEPSMDSSSSFVPRPVFTPRPSYSPPAPVVSAKPSAPSWQPPMSFSRHLLPSTHQNPPAPDPSSSPLKHLMEVRAQRQDRQALALPQAPTVSAPRSSMTL